MFIKIESFTTEHRSFGAVKAYKATIGNKIEGAVIIPYRTHHQSNIIEIIAPVFLRKELQIQEGGIVDVTLYG
jgi:riboflavin kinase